MAPKASSASCSHAGRARARAHVSELWSGAQPSWAAAELWPGSPWLPAGGALALKVHSSRRHSAGRQCSLSSLPIQNHSCITHLGEPLDLLQQPGRLGLCTQRHRARRQPHLIRHNRRVVQAQHRAARAQVAHVVALRRGRSQRGTAGAQVAAGNTAQPARGSLQEPARQPTPARRAASCVHHNHT